MVIIFSEQVEYMSVVQMLETQIVKDELENKNI